MIAAEVAQLLEPLERFEAIRRKRARLGSRLIDLSYANPYSGVGRGVREVMADALADERTLDLQYTPFGGHSRARRAAADALRGSHRAPFTFADVVLTPGAMSALQVVLRSVARPDGEVVIPTPCWLDHPLYARASGLKPELVELDPEEGDLDVERIVAAVSPRTCAVVVSHPANPTGRNHDSGALKRLGAALREAERAHGIELTLVADETHRDFVRPGEYVSASSAFPRTVIVYSFGKYHFIQGQRLGYAAVSPDHPDRRRVAEELVRWTRIAGVATPTALMQRALPGLLGLEHDHGWLEHWRDWLVSGLREAGYTVAEPDATMFVYARTPSAYADDFAFAERLAEEGLLVLPAPLFHHRGWFRVSLTGTEEMMVRALPLLERVEAG